MLQERQSGLSIMKKFILLFVFLGCVPLHARANTISVTMTGCAADRNFEITNTRNNSRTATNTGTAVGVKFAEVTTGVI